MPEKVPIIVLLGTDQSDRPHFAYGHGDLPLLKAFKAQSWPEIAGIWRMSVQIR